MLFNVNFVNFWLVVIILNIILLSLVYFVFKKLLILGGIVYVWILGVLIWGSLGWFGYVVVVFYFLVGFGVICIGMVEK